MVHVDHEWQVTWGGPGPRSDAETRDRTGDLQTFALTLSQLSYRGYISSLPQTSGHGVCSTLFTSARQLVM